MINTFESLLRKTAELLEENKELAQLKGENFNIFSILNMETKEVNTHSNFITDLLNPKGSHQLGDVFLKAFLHTINLSPELVEDSPEVQVHKEFVFNAGRLDILVESNAFVFVIENKIYASDGDLQLKKYHSYVNKNPKEYSKVLYLTLHGEKASLSSAGDLIDEEDYYCISYENEIRAWLQSCIKEAAEYPVIRETIKQYLILINKLTGKLNNEKMEKNLIELMTQNESAIEAAQYIKDNYDNAINQLKINQVELLKELILAENNERLKPSDLSTEKAKRAADGLFIKLKSFKLEDEFYDLGINIELDNNYYFFCIARKGEKRNTGINNDPKFREIREEIQSKLNGELDKYNSWTIAGSSAFEVGVKTNYYYPSVNNRSVFKHFAETLTNSVIAKF